MRDQLVEKKIKKRSLFPKQRTQKVDDQLFEKKNYFHKTNPYRRPKIGTELFFRNRFDKIAFLIVRISVQVEI